MNKLIKSKRDRVETLKNILTGVLLLGVFFLFLKLGAFSGRTIYSVQANLVRNTEVSVFKGILNNAIQLIDICYNSGKSSISFSGELKSFVGSIFTIDTKNPETILSSQLPIINQYSTSYRNSRYAASSRGNTGGTAGSPNTNSPNTNNNTRPNTSSTGPNEQASGISMDEEYEHSQSFPGQSGIVVTEEKVPVENKVTIKNDTKFKIDVEALAKEALNIKFDKKGPKFLIFHTHTSEAYLKSLKDIQDPEIPSWSTDSRYNVVRVGEELAENLRKNYDLEVIHNGTQHDTQSYDGSYTRSLETVSSIMKSYPSIRFALDLHRDGLSDTPGGEKLRMVSNIDKKPVAPIMFVVGTDHNGQYHPRWRENLKLAIQLQEKLNSYYPGLTRPINVRTGRFNQHVSTGALLIEVGGDGNTLEEAMESVRYLSRAFGELVSDLD